MEQMKEKDRHVAVLFMVVLLGQILMGCTPNQAPDSTNRPLVIVAPTQDTSPTATVQPNPTPAILSNSDITLGDGDFYFSFDGRQSFLFSRNPAGYLTNQYKTMLVLSKTGGSKFVRLHLDNFGMGYSSNGGLDEAWAQKWETVFDEAAKNGIFVLPVFGVWYDWNDASPTGCVACSYTQWPSNPFNEVNGGPAKASKELFMPDSVTQQLWLGWMKTLVERWQERNNIIAWEIFSEVNLVPGVSESDAVDFVDKAAFLIRDTDTLRRPITASLADFGDWSSFYNNERIDFINIHLYPVSGELDTFIIRKVRSALATYQKPVFIGESGLSFEVPDSDPPTLTTADRADIGIRHAMWASVVSGAMNGRSLWWEDSVAIYFPTLSMSFIRKYSTAELPAANFVQDIDFANFQPLRSETTSSVLGAAIGNENLVLGWFRDASCEPPDWKLQPQISGQMVTITVTGTATSWQVDFYSTENGTDVIESIIVTQSGDQVRVTLPDFKDDIAFKMKAQ